MTNVIAIVVPIVLSVIFIAVSFYLYTIFCHRTYLSTQSIGLWSWSLSLGQNRCHHCPVTRMGSALTCHPWPLCIGHCINQFNLWNCLCGHILLNRICPPSLLWAVLGWLRRYKMQTISQSIRLSLHYCRCLVCSHLHQLHLALQVHWPYWQPTTNLCPFLHVPDPSTCWLGTSGNQWGFRLGILPLWSHNRFFQSTQKNHQRVSFGTQEITTKQKRLAYWRRIKTKDWGWRIPGKIIRNELFFETTTSRTNQGLD